MPDQQSSEVRYIANALRKLERIAALIARYFNQNQSLDDVWRETAEGIGTRLDNIERSLALVMKAIESGLVKRHRSTGDLFRTALEEHRESLKNRLEIHNKTLNRLREQAAAEGAFPSVGTMNQIDVVEQNIARIEADLRTFES